MRLIRWRGVCVYVRSGHIVFRKLLEASMEDKWKEYGM